MTADGIINVPFSFTEIVLGGLCEKKGVLNTPRNNSPPLMNNAAAPPVMPPPIVNGGKVPPTEPPGA